MRLWIYSKLLDTLLRMEKTNGLYLRLWKLWHQEKRREHRGKIVYSKGSR